MAISLVAVGGKITAALLNAIIGQVNGIALNGIVPTSVAGTGVTVTPSGQVTFTNASTVSLNGVFSGSFDNYRITWSSPTRPVSATLAFRLRQSGTDVATTTYDYVRGYDSGTARNVSSSSASAGTVLDANIASGQTSNGVLDLFGPALASATAGTSQSTVLASSAVTSIQVGFTNETAASCDGFTLYLTSAGTFSGTVRVYGYNNLT